MRGTFSLTLIPSSLCISIFQENSGQFPIEGAGIEARSPPAGAKTASKVPKKTVSESGEKDDKSNASVEEEEMKNRLNRLEARMERLEEGDSKSSFMFDHMDRKHPLTRQVSEAVRIKTAVEKGIYIDNKNEKHEINSLNRRLEHFAPIERRKKSL